jgi:hypothetical protein
MARLIQRPSAGVKALPIFAGFFGPTEQLAEKGLV